MTTTSKIYSFPSTGEQYRQIPAISNSDLTEYKHYLFGRKFRKPQKAFEFGSILHETILEPHGVDPGQVESDQNHTDNHEHHGELPEVTAHRPRAQGARQPNFVNYVVVTVNQSSRQAPT